MDNIILCGLPLTGKSFLGEQLAKALSWSFVDTDRRIEQLHRQDSCFLSCREIYARKGEEFFRELEHEVIAQLHGTKNAVIAIGGGALSKEAAAKLLQAIGKIIYLRAPLDLILQRLKQKKSLPAYLSTHSAVTEFVALAERRIPLYEQHAHFTLDIDQHTHAETILNALQLEDVKLPSSFALAGNTK
jgi:shikimate kinase